MMAAVTEQKGILLLHRSGVPLDPTSKSGPKVYILLSHYPGFESYVKAFEKDHHVVRVAFPESAKTQWGYSMQDIELALVAVVQECRQKYNCKSIYLHGYSWGAYVVLKLVQHYPLLVTKIVLQQVGVMTAQSDLFDILSRWWQHGYLACIFILSRLFGDSLASMCILSSSSSSRTFYPYFRGIFSGATVCTEGMPQYFVYGIDQNLAYHSHEYLVKLATAPKCRCKGFVGGENVHETHEADLQRNVRLFLAER